MQETNLTNLVSFDCEGCTNSVKATKKSKTAVFVTHTKRTPHKRCPFIT